MNSFLNLFILLLFISCQEVVEVAPGSRGELIVSSSDSNAFTQKLIGTETVATFTLRHSGGTLPINIISVSEFSDESPFSYYGDAYPGIGGTCGNQLTSGQSCTFTVIYRPMVKGSWNDSVDIIYNDGIETKSMAVPLLGTSGDVAYLEIFDDNFEDTFGVREPGSHNYKVITIKNTGGLVATNMTPTILGTGEINYRGGTYPGIGGTCSSTLASGSICYIVMDFAPTANGSQMITFTLDYTNPDSPAALVQSLSGIAAEIIASIRFLGGSGYDYGSTTVGSPLSKTYQIVNSGYNIASGISIIVAAPYVLQSTTCGATLSVSESCTMVVNFDPQAGGVFPSTLGVSYNNSREMALSEFSLEGIGIPPGNVIFKNDIMTQITTFDFPKMNIEVDFYLNNNGSFTISNLAITSPAAPFSVVGSYCSTSLAPTQNCKVILSFDPSAPGSFNEPFTVTYNNGSFDTSSSLDLTATISTVAHISISNYNWGVIPVGGYKDKTITITNDGFGPANNVNVPLIDGQFSYPGGAFPGTGGTCPAGAGFVLNMGENCTFVQRFTPSVAGLQQLEQEITYNNGEEDDSSSGEYTLTGQLPANIVFEYYGIETTSRDFGLLGQNYQQFSKGILQLHNVGNLTAINMDVSFGSGTVWFWNEWGPGQVYTPGVYPGLYSPISPDLVGDCGNTLSSGQSCKFFIYFESPNVGVFTDTLTATYDNGLIPDATSTLNLSAEVDFIAVLSITPRGNIIEFDPTAKGGINDMTFTITNNGVVDATAFTVNDVDLPFEVLGAPDTTCGVTIPPANSCEVVIRFNAPDVFGTKFEAVTFEYHNGREIFQELRNVSAAVVSPANITITEDPEYNFEYVEIGNSSSKIFTVRNTGGLPAETVSVGGLAAPYSIIANTCPATLNVYSTCMVTVQFAPTIIGTEHVDDLEVSYWDGKEAMISSRTIKGTGETYRSTHKGWTEIFAQGDTVDIYNNTSSDRRITISWNIMIPSNGTITGYSVYRYPPINPLPEGWEGRYKWDEPIASDIDVNNRTFTDTNISHSTAYFYIVRPIILDNPSRTLENFSEIRVIAPPANMNLVHRRMANKDICTKIGMTPDKNNNNRCLYTGIGGDGARFDIGYDMVIDRFELGTDSTNRKGQLPKISLSQQTAWTTCQGMSAIVISEIDGTSFDKRIMSRKEFNIAASWSSALSNAEILALESGSTMTAMCNGNGSALENTGLNTQCVSRYGIMDMAGNSWEWVSDRVIAGYGVDSDAYKLDVGNTDLDGLYLGDVDDGYIYNAGDCFSLVLGMPHQLDSGTCQGSVGMGTLDPASFHNDYFWSPGVGDIMLPLAGGSYSSNTYSGIYSTAWVPYTVNAGGRCMIEVDSTLGFPAE